MSKHTPGPWVAHEFANPFGNRRKHDHDWGIHGDTDNQAYNVAITEWIPGGVSKANAHLIAAAPDMLRALDNAMIDPSKPLRPWQQEMICAALEKARGYDE